MTGYCRRPAAHRVDPGSAERGRVAGVARHHRRSSPGRILLLTTASAVLPGTAHLVSGHRRTGLAIAATAAAVVGGLLGFVLTSSRQQLLGMAVRPDWLA